MTEVIRSAGDSRDGVCIKRKQPSTALKQMPHYTTWGGTYLTENIGANSGPGGTTFFTENIGSTGGPGGSTYLTGYAEADGFMKLGDIRGEFAPSRQADGVSNQHAQFTTGGGGDSVHQEPDTSDVVPGIKQTSVADALINGGTDGYTEVEWTYLKGDVWTNGSATSFEDRIIGDYDANDAVFGVKENIDWTAANGGPGSSYLTAKNASQSNAYVDEYVDGFMKLGDIKGELQTTDITRENRFFNELNQGSDFVASTNPVLEVGRTTGPGGSTFLTENVGGNSGPGGTTFMTGYAEAIGLDSSIFDVVNKLTGSADPGGDDV